MGATMQGIQDDVRGEFDHLDAPDDAFVERMRGRYPVEPETDALLVRKLRRRGGAPYAPVGLVDLTASLERMLDHELGGAPFELGDQRWFTGGASKIQMGFTLRWEDPDSGDRRTDRLMVRMEPTEGLNATSRVRELELLRAFEGVIPVPHAFWVDDAARWFPEPALIYAVIDGVTKPAATPSGQVTGLGTNFGPGLRERLAPQFVDHLARIHTFESEAAELGALGHPTAGTPEGALWQLNRARRVWEEDRGEDVPLMEVAAGWLERHAPPVDRVSVVHGDYRSGNFLFDEASAQITGWLDWERAHLGDRHRDLAWTTQPAFGHYAEDGRTLLVSGLVPLEEFYEQYERASGLAVDPQRLAWYRVLNAYQMVVTTVGSSYRVVRLGKSHQDILIARLVGLTGVAIQGLRTILEEVL